MLVSVIMPTYNCGPYIEEALKSVIVQTVTDWEIQIIDDCSTDNTAQILKPYLDGWHNIHYHLLPSREGVAAARNEGIKRASGRYIAFLDSDDVWKPEKLEKQIAFMQERQVGFSCTAYGRMDGSGRIQKFVWVPPTKINYRKCLLLSNPIGNLTVMYDKELINECTVPCIEKRNDFALWLKILKRTDYCYGMKEVLAVYRTGRNSSVSYHKIRQAKYHWLLYHQIEKHSIFRSIFEMGCWVVVKGLGIGSGKRKMNCVPCSREEGKHE